MVLGENGEIRTRKVCTYQDRFPLYYTHTVEMCKLERVSFPKSNQIPFLEPGWPRGLQEELFPPFSAPHLILPDVAGVGVGTADAQWPCATVPPSWSPVFAEFNVCFLFLVYLWSVNVESRSVRGSSQGNTQIPVFYWENCGWALS